MSAAPKTVADLWADDRRYGVELLFHEKFNDWTAAAWFFDTTPRTIMRWIQTGVDYVQADHIAIRLGMHPTQIWPDWGDLPAAVFNDPIPNVQEQLGGCPGCRACRPKRMVRVWPKETKTTCPGCGAWWTGTEADPEWHLDGCPHGILIEEAS